LGVKVSVGDIMDKNVATLFSLQALRALAAWLVVIDHAMLTVARVQGYPEEFVHLAWAIGNTGVYVFFAISGFVMVHTSFENFGSRRSALDFGRRRIVRIVPLYWIATLAAFALHQVVGEHDEGLVELAKSLLFIPYPNELGLMRPVLQQGWTLNFEMAFYAIFAIGMLFRATIALPAILILLCGLSLAPLVLTTNAAAAFLMGPIILWFGLGISLGWIYRRMGAPREPVRWQAFCRPLDKFGNASYSLYLVHGFALNMLWKGAALASGYAPGPEFVVIGLVFATGVGLAVHLLLEKPLLYWTSRLISRLNSRRAGTRVMRRYATGGSDS
jgi:exopolysaccharide production protein ExoZ